MTQQGLSRPTLAKLNEDYPKIKNIINASEIEDLINFLVRILNIKPSNQEEQDSLDFQIPLILDFIKTKFGSLTIPEIKEAFKMYVAKEFAQVKVFRILDCVSVSEVLNAFIDFRSDNLRAYSQKKSNIQNQLPMITETEKEEIVKQGVNKAFLDYKETKEMPIITEYLFDFLIEKKLIINNNNPKVVEYYQSKLKEASIQVKKELQQEVFSDDFAIRQKAKDDLEKLINGNSSKTIIRAKRIVLIEFFEKQIKLGNEVIFK